MRILLISILTFVLLAPVGFGQQGQTVPINPQTPPPPPSTEVPGLAGSRNGIRVVVNLVLIDARVTDRNGKPIRGLQSDRFTVVENDKVQKISSFEYFDTSGIEKAAPNTQKPLVIPLSGLKPPQEVEQELQRRRLVILFYDLTSMQTDQLLRAIRAGESYLREQMSPADLISVVTFGNQLRVVANFTDNRDALLRAVGNIRPGKDAELADLADAAAGPGEIAAPEDTGAAFAADETEFNIFNTDRKLMAMESLADLVRQIPGKKSVIHFTGGISQTGEENRSQLLATADAANRANMSIYTVDTRGLYATIPGGEASIGAAQQLALFNGASVHRQTEMRHVSRDTLVTLAVDTGGKAFFDRGDFHEVFQQVQEEGTGYYLLGYYSTDARQDGRWRRVQVKVDAPGAHIQYRQGYYADRNSQQTTTADRQQQLNEAMRSDAPRVDLPMALSTAHFRLNDHQYFVPLEAKLDSNALDWGEKEGKHEAEFQFAAEVRDEKSHKIVSALQDSVMVSLAGDQFQKGHRRPLQYHGGFILPPGQYRLKFLAREDSTGRIGTFEDDVNLPEPKTEQMELSSLLLSNQVERVRTSYEVKRKALGPDANLKMTPLDTPAGRIVPSVTRVFTPEQKILVYFQAYLPAPFDSSTLRGGLVFFSNGEWKSETPLTPPTDLNEKTRVASFRVELPLEKFPAGQYEIQAVVVSADGGQAAFAANYFALQVPTQSEGASPRPAHE